MANLSSVSKASEESPFEFTSTQWNIIARTNAVLSAFVVKNGQAEITRSKFPAFQFQDEIEGLPPFDVMDDSSINITELTSDFESAALNSCFSATDVQATLDGGPLAIACSSLNLGVDGSVNIAKSSLTGTSQKSSRNDLYASYEFPRVVLYLDENSIEPSRPCKQALEALRSDPSVEAVLKFMDKFGHIYSREVALGGRLQCLRASQSVSGSTISEKKDNLRAEASAQFSAFGASAGLSANRARLDERMSDLSVSDTARSIAWEARGGDTTLSANPSAWAASIKLYRNWRVIHRNEVVPLYVLLGSCQGWEWVPELFERVLKQVQVPAPAKQTHVAEKAVEVPVESVNSPPLWGTSIATTFLRVNQDGGSKGPIQVHTSIIFYQDALGFLRCGFYDSLNSFEAIVPERICRAKIGTPLATVALLDNFLDAFRHSGRITTLRVFYLDEQSVLCDRIYSFAAGTWNRQTSTWSGEWTDGSLRTMNYQPSEHSFLSVDADIVDRYGQPSTGIVLGFYSRDGIFTVTRHLTSKPNSWQTLHFGTAAPAPALDSTPYLTFYSGWLTVQFVGRDGLFKSLRSDFADRTGQSPYLGPHKLENQPKHVGRRSKMTVHSWPQSLQHHFSIDIDNPGITFRTPQNRLYDISTRAGTKTPVNVHEVCSIPEKSRFVCAGQILPGTQMIGVVLLHQGTDGSLVIRSVRDGSNVFEPRRLFVDSQAKEFSMQDFYMWAYSRVR